MTIEEIKARVTEIDAKLDGDITDNEFTALEKEASELTAELGRLELVQQFRSVKTLNRVNDWTINFLRSFESGTRTITNRQGQCFYRINGGKPFIFEGRRYDCTGANYRNGFATLIVTNI